VLGPDGRIQGTTAKLLAVDVPAPLTLPDPAELQLANPTDASWQDRIRLLGYEHTSRASIGDTIVVELIWLSLDTLADDLSVRLELVDGSGVATHGETFAISEYPTSRWRAGELIDALYDLRLPAELEGARYRLLAQVLDAAGEPMGGAAELGEIDVSAQERLFELPQPPQYPLDLTLGDGIRLLGYDLPATTSTPGGEVPLTLYWACEDTPETSYTVFVHLLDPSGAVRGQADTPPADGKAPTSGWVPGQIVIDPYLIPVAGFASAGSYQLEVGMYDPQGVVRLPIVDGAGVRLPDDRVLLQPAITIDEP
jgi:hypothetical protein